MDKIPISLYRGFGDNATIMLSWPAHNYFVFFFFKTMFVKHEAINRA